MFSILLEEHKKVLWDLLPLLIAIYCAAILGDYVSEALVIKMRTVDALPGLFQVNAVALFAVSALLFRVVDRVHRWRLIQGLSLLLFAIVAACGALLQGHPASAQVLYVTAYTGKLSLFVVFWIIAGDLCDTRKSKAVFPVLAGGGLVGGLLTTLLAGKIIRPVGVENMLFVWAVLLLLPLFLVQRLKRRYAFSLQAPDLDEPRSVKNEFLQIAGERAVLVMAAAYFLVFLLLFNVDFLFAKTLSHRFTAAGAFDAEGFVAFKFNAYLAVTTAIVLFQFVVTSNVSRRLGVTHSILILPLVFAAAFLALFFWDYSTATEPSFALFAFVTGFYCLRQLLFETLFSSNYQIFFSAFTRKFRGKGKLFLEGVVKPLGVASAGLFIFSFEGGPAYCLLLAIISALLAVAVAVLTREYGRVLLQEEVETPRDDLMRLLKHELSGRRKDKLLSLIARALDTPDYDLKRVLVKHMEYSGNPAAFEVLRKKFYEETDRMRELIANSLSTFDSLEARGFLRNLLEDKNAAIRAGALRSIRRNPAIRPKRFDFHSLVYDHHPQVFEEASLLLYPELSRELRNVVQDKIGEYLNSDRIDETVAALRLIGALKLALYYDRVPVSLFSPSREVFRAATEALFNSGEEKGVRTLVDFTDQDVERAKENFIIQTLGRLPEERYPLVEELFLSTRKKRTAFSLIRVLRLLSLRHLELKGRPVRQSADVRQKLVSMAMEEMQTVYLDVHHYYNLRLHLFERHKEVDLLKDALVNRRSRFALFVLDMLALLDNTGALLSIDRNFKHLDGRERANVIELVETFGERNIGRFLIPILEEYGERELLKIGSQKWPFRAQSARESIAYFKALDNRWVFFVSLYLERTTHAA